MERELEIRTAAQTFELRATGKGPGTLVGYASVFNRYSQNLGGFVEQVAPGAFDKSLADGVPVMCRGNHEDEFLLGTTWAQTLRLSVDGTGLLYEDDLPDTTPGRDFAVLTQRGDVKWSSFAFRTIDDDWGITEQGFPLRTLLQVLLVDVAPVNSPAYLDTTVAARSFDAYRAATLNAAGDPADLDNPERIGDMVADALRSAGKDGQRATHPSIAARRRRLDLLAKQ